MLLPTFKKLLGYFLRGFFILNIFNPQPYGEYGEIHAVRLTIAAADDLEMELDVLRLTLRQRAQQVTAQLSTTGTRESVSPPDLA